MILFLVFYLVNGFCNVFFKWFCQRDLVKPFNPVTKSNFWKSFLFWPYELYLMLSGKNVF